MLILWNNYFDTSIIFIWKNLPLFRHIQLVVHITLFKHELLIPLLSLYNLFHSIIFISIYVIDIELENWLFTYSFIQIFNYTTLPYFPINLQLGYNCPDIKRRPIKAGIILTDFELRYYDSQLCLKRIITIIFFYLQAGLLPTLNIFSWKNRQSYQRYLWIKSADADNTVI